jgi:hypothetical protein
MTLKTLRNEWPSIRRAPWSFAIGAVAAAVLASLLVSQYYHRQLAARDGRIVAAQSELKRFEERFKSSHARIKGTPRDALDLVEILRDMIENATERQGLFSAFGTDTPFTPKDFARYERRYRVRAQVLREFFLSKLPPAERSERVQRAYEGPLTLDALRLIADDLERLARKVPD